MSFRVRIDLQHSVLVVKREKMRDVLSDEPDKSRQTPYHKTLESGPCLLKGRM